jgi:hypothetical protein
LDKKLSLGLHKGRYKRSLQLSKENTQHFKTRNFLIFFYFCGSFLPSWIRILNIESSNTERGVQDTIVDVIGICKATNDLVQITSRAGKELTKREITLVDQSSTEVSQSSLQLCYVG